MDLAERIQTNFRDSATLKLSAGEQLSGPIAAAIDSRAILRHRCTAGVPHMLQAIEPDAPPRVDDRRQTDGARRP